MIRGKYHPTFLQQCKNAIEWSKTAVEQWLRTGMFEEDRRAAAKAARIVKALTDDDSMKNHGRHVHINQCRDLKLRIVDLEADQQLQDLVLTTHHAFMQTLSEAGQVTKIVENQKGVALVSSFNATPRIREPSRISFERDEIEPVDQRMHFQRHLDKFAELDGGI